MFDKVLIANRGAIACRNIRTLRAMGLRSVAVYSKADAGSLHVAQADEAVGIGEALASETYLDAGKVLRAATDTGAGAIHPGYGFLSENASFAEACAEHGIAFVGPTPQQLRDFGLKHTARDLALGLAACGTTTPDQASTTVEPAAAPSQTPAPLPTSAPTVTAEPPTAAPTETPVGQIFRDDFSGSFGPGWDWEAEDVRRWEITEDGWLQIAGEYSSLLWEGDQSNVLWRDLPEGDFQITVRVQAAPTENFQQATIYIYEDGENYVALNRGYCAPCTPGGNAVFMEYKIGGGFGAYKYPTTATELFLRLVSIGTEMP